jgi:ribosome-associated protein
MLFMKECIIREVEYRTSRSSGPGGQHVNKTETRVELIWNLSASVCLDEEQKYLLRSRLASRLTERDVLILASEKYRSQARNREDVTKRFLSLVDGSLAKPKKRFETKPTRASREKRIRRKKERGEIKKLRMDPPAG